MVFKKKRSVSQKTSHKSTPTTSIQSTASLQQASASASTAANKTAATVASETLEMPAQATASTSFDPCHRIVDIEYFFNGILELQFQHFRGGCREGRLAMCEEVRYGLLSKIILRCKACNEQFQMFTEKPRVRDDQTKISATT